MPFTSAPKYHQIRKHKYLWNLEFDKTHLLSVLI
jgi:hypothetical protein